MALAGKAAGKDVGMWFGPSAAAGAVRMLVDGFPVCGLGVSVATDGTLYQNEVFAASHAPASVAGHSQQSSAHSHGSYGSHTSNHSHNSYNSHTSSTSHASSNSHGKSTAARGWGGRPVLLLIGTKLGMDGVNPVYYETIKLLYTFPQTVGIAGGRPSSSYYFIGVQGDGLFYLDPHHARPAVPLKPFPGEAAHSTHAGAHSTHATHDGRRSLSPDVPRGGSMSPDAYARGGSLSPDFARGGSLSPDFARGDSVSPDFVRAGSGSPDFGRGHTPMTEDELICASDRNDGGDTTTTNSSQTTARPGMHSTTPIRTPTPTPTRPPAGGVLSPAEEAHFTRAYSSAELRTFHCARVRKMPLSGLDPSMLIGFVVRDEAEWIDLRRRIGELPRTIFAIQDEPPTWPGADDDDDMGLESVSDPEEEAGLDDGDMSSVSHAPESSVGHGVSSSVGHGAFPSAGHTRTPSSETSHAASSTFSHTHVHSNSNSTNSSSARSEEVDTEEDAVAPITPLPNARFSLPPAGAYADAELEGEDEFVDARGADIEDDWVDPITPPPKIKKSKSGKSGKRRAVPVPSVHYPFPVSGEESAGPGVGGAAAPQQERQERQRNVTVSPRAGAGGGGQRMHTARARDGGRTQSGGVRGVLTED
ncbi:hypothetical protein C8R44DRAFT_846331 [Mycena epipterygia]|nr:hypothetical protein C8R44DRAFT_846331 [Mycena epipterygia]